MWDQPYKRSLKGTRPVRGSISRFFLPDHRLESGAYGFISSEGYAGANPLMDLYTRSRILKMIRDLTGIQ